MDEAQAELSEWTRLYQAAVQIKAMGPWHWMEEAEVFGVQNPETGDLGFVSVMGAGGEHLSIALYHGSEGLYGFWGLADSESVDDVGDILSIRHLQASFEDRAQLTDRDRNVIKRLGLKFRGRQAWPLFRSYLPGYFPYYLNAREVRLLACTLEQTLELAPRVREDPGTLKPGGADDYLVRVSCTDKDRLVWEDRVVAVPPPEPGQIAVYIDSDVLERLTEIPQQPMTLEIDLSVHPAGLGARGERQPYGYHLLAVDGKSGFILGSQLLTPDPTLEAMYGRVPEAVAHILIRAQIVPQEVRARSPILLSLLEPLVDEVGLRLVFRSRLPALDRASDFITSRFV